VKYEDIGKILIGNQSASWKDELLTRLRSVTSQRPFSRQEFESYLIRNKAIFEQIASQYHVNIKELMVWYKNELSRLLEQRRIDRGSDLSWQTVDLVTGRRIVLAYIKLTKFSRNIGRLSRDKFETKS